MSESVTIVVVPRDRFSSVVPCVKSILENTAEPFRLAILDLGYSPETLQSLRETCRSSPVEIVTIGYEVPILAFQQYLPRISTPYTAWIDNDTFVEKGWLTALLDRVRQGARVVLPVTLEREGLDVDSRELALRNHISHSELRKVTVGETTYIFDHKPFRRAAPEDIPNDPHVVDFFELHTFFAETDVLRALDIPAMVVREHIDLGIQLHRMGIDIWCEPKARVYFDNIHERPTLEDLKFFFYRWNEGLINSSHEQFERRWGYRFYNEQFMKNWAFRRKVFSVCRFLRLPSKPSDLASRVLNRFLRRPIPAELSGNPLERSERVLEARNGVETARSTK